MMLAWILLAAVVLVTDEHTPEKISEKIKKMKEEK